MLTEAVAEFTWALILGDHAAGRRGRPPDPRGGWKGWALDFMLGIELRGKQLGIIGGGRIGRAVAAKAPAFGMTRGLRGEARDSRRGGMSLDELLVTSDVVSHPRAADAARRGT